MRVRLLNSILNLELLITVAVGYIGFVSEKCEEPNYRNAVDGMLETNFRDKQVHFLRRCRRLICFACKIQPGHKSYAI